MTGCKNKDFEICAGNSDAECFDEDILIAEKQVTNNPSICDICAYNKKHSHHDYKSWKKYRKEIGIPPK